MRWEFKKHPPIFARTSLYLLPAIRLNNCFNNFVHVSGHFWNWELNFWWSTEPA